VRLCGIYFFGYKRLANTSCNVDGRLIAFLGPNESGKSSVLEALDWLSAGDDELPAHRVSRGQSVKPDESVVRARFLLDDDDQAELADLDLVGSLSEFSVYRDRDGTKRTGVSPALSRNPEPFQEARQALTRCRDLYSTWFMDPPGTEGAGAWATELDDVLKRPDEQWPTEATNAAESLIDLLQAEAGDLSNNDVAAIDTARKTAAALVAVRALSQKPHPAEEARRRLGKRCPDFVLFAERDRTLETLYNLADRNLRAAPPQALVNLLTVAGTSIADIWAAKNSEDVTRLKTLVKRANRRLEQRLSGAWRQSRLTVSLDTDAEWLQVLVDELDESGARTAITERSDGLKTFLALTCFLAAREMSPAPILLIDEAETHLHYDAQADLIDFLMNQTEASQVIYTTHSPGCLPPDLGTGVRFVEPDAARRDVSVLRADFWSRSEPGFSPLLFAMGAGAAAFSALRYALLTEGAADMILLPTLIRRATGASNLAYQVAPGLSGFNDDLGMEEVAARVAYLVDGDAEGRKYKKRLTDASISAERIWALPKGMATEDLLDINVYLAAVNALLKDAGQALQLGPDDLADTETVSKAVASACARHGVKAPGKVAVASKLIQQPESLVLRESAADFLRRLHADVSTLFGAQ